MRLSNLKNKLMGKRPAPPGPETLIEEYLNNGREPWSKGYMEYRASEFTRLAEDEAVLSGLRAGNSLPSRFGRGVDERIVEYPWFFSELKAFQEARGAGREKLRLLDGGSVLNFDHILNLLPLDQIDLTIAGLAVEQHCFYDRGISYSLCDLREMPFRSDWFDLVTSISTIEHIGMDNAIYGHGDELAAQIDQKKFASIPAVEDLCRVTSKAGQLLLTFPVGKYEDHGFFQQFDRPMQGAVLEVIKRSFVSVEESYFRYTNEGWVGSEWKDCEDIVSHNPHTGSGIGDDGAAHCRAVLCIKAGEKR